MMTGKRSSHGGHSERQQRNSSSAASAHHSGSASGRSSKAGGINYISLFYVLKLVRFSRKKRMFA